VVIAGTLVLIFYMFDATKSFAEAWIGTVVGCLVTTALMSITMQMVLQMITTYIQKIGVLPVSSHGFGINITEGAEVLINIAVMFIVGFFLMVMAFILGFAIGRSAGINASAVLQRFARPV
ncbi:MAG: type IV secretion system protein, partial [Proteobacteria bacterium]|nr:type IV secretion system protein [Pseudomonadota bacterium]